jgi:hypothetical protein
MAGQQNYLYLSQEAYYDKAEEEILRSADLYYISKRFGVGEGPDKEKLRHNQLFYNILCTDECEIADWINKKINGDLEGRVNKLKMKDHKVYDFNYGYNDSDKISDCCNWGELEW